jgi:multimeric flavodoxin WrbA
MIRITTFLYVIKGGVSMRIVIINSSGRRNGNTGRLLSLFEEQLFRLANEMKISLEVCHVTLFDEDIRLCMGCRSCFEKGETFCPLKDSILSIRDKLLLADGLVLASPVYVEDINGMMKNWLDRMAFNCHRPAYFGKCALAVTTSGSGATRRSLRTMGNALEAWGFCVTSMKNYRMGARMDEKEIKRRFSAEVLHSASVLMNSIRNHMAWKPSVFSLISLHVQQTYYRKSKGIGQIDRKYWEKNGWLDRGAYYYMPVRTTRIKILFARLTGHVVVRFFM